MLDAFHTKTPLSVKQASIPYDSTAVDTTEYRRLMGSLQYLTFMWLEIFHAISRVCQHFQNPSVAHIREVKIILRYLKEPMSFGLRIIHKSSLDLTRFSDANRVSCSITCRSTSRHCIFLGANCVLWSSKK